jgi:glutamate-5-semialdehyde dehydrogenase
METNIENYVSGICDRAKKSSYFIAKTDGYVRNDVLSKFADELSYSSEELLSENEQDITEARKKGMSDAMTDRLMLTKERISGLAESVQKLIDLPDPIGSGRTWRVPNGLDIECIRVPIGVIGVVFEARPNVSADISALCIKSGNACVLRGGSEAIRTNKKIVEFVRKSLRMCGLPEDIVVLVESTDRQAVNQMKKMKGKIDLLIPRGGRSLIASVTENALVPIIETGAGNCHVYVDETADLDMAVKITLNAKVSRPSVCNAAESLLVNRKIAEPFLEKLAPQFEKYGVELRGCPETCKIVHNAKKASDEDYATEYNDLIMSCRVVGSVEEAVEHINRYSTHHSEAIITENIGNAEYFKTNVDSAAVYVNASTRFTDGQEFGFGAEVGISTSKIHARGPMGLDALTTVKYLVDGQGQIR